MALRMDGPVAVAACLLIAVPWTFVLRGDDVTFALFALAPPLLMAAAVLVRRMIQAAAGLAAHRICTA